MISLAESSIGHMMIDADRFFRRRDIFSRHADPIQAGNIHKDQQIVNFSVFNLRFDTGTLRNKIKIRFLPLQVNICLYLREIVLRYR